MTQRPSLYQKRRQARSWKDLWFLSGQTGEFFAKAFRQRTILNRVKDTSPGGFFAFFQIRAITDRELATGRKVIMYQTIQFKTTTLPIRNSISKSPLRRALHLIQLVFVCFALSPVARAVIPPPDGSYP